MACNRERPQKHHQIVDLRRCQMQWPQEPLALGVEPLFVDFGIVPHHIRQRREAAVVHIRGGVGDVAQGRDAKLAPVAVQQGHMPGGAGG